MSILNPPLNIENLLTAEIGRLFGITIVFDLVCQRGQPPAGETSFRFDGSRLLRSSRISGYIEVSCDRLIDYVSKPTTVNLTQYHS
jgi:hypothetical protein